MFQNPALWIENLFLSNYALTMVLGLVIALLIFIGHLIWIFTYDK